MDAESRLKANEFLNMRHQAIEQEHREFKATVRYQTLLERCREKERMAPGLTAHPLPPREALWGHVKREGGKTKCPGARIDLLVESLAEEPSFLSDKHDLSAPPELGETRGRNITYCIL